jgi:hypothetical protein
MGFLDKLFGRGGGGGGMDVPTAISSLGAMYSDPEVRSESGISITSRQANEVRDIGRALHKAGGKPAMEQARDALRAQHSWAVANLEAIWSSLPEWQG